MICDEILQDMVAVRASFGDLQRECGVLLQKLLPMQPLEVLKKMRDYARLAVQKRATVVQLSSQSNPLSEFSDE